MHSVNRRASGIGRRRGDARGEAQALGYSGPERRTHNRRERDRAPDQDRAPSKRKTVLIVDDDPQFCELYRTSLQFRGFAVTTASDGLAALQSIHADPPSVVILDLNMPCVDGWGVLRELASHQATKGIPVIVVTAADVDGALRDGVAILRKPVLPDQLIPMIERHVRAF